jgi:methyl-accepting chemotaxis protein
MACLKLKVGGRILVIVVAAVAGMAVIAMLGVQRLHDVMLQDRENKTQQLVEIAYGLVAGFEAQARAGILSTEEAQRRALTALGPLRTSDEDYFWVNDMQPVMLLHPMQHLIGTDVSGITDPAGKALFVEMVDLVRNQGAGFVPYQWPKEGHDQPVPKISYVKGFTPWGWVIGTGIYIDDVDAMFEDQLVLLGGIVLVIMVGVVGLSLWISRSIVRPIREMTAAMGELAGGDLDVPVPALARTDEIGGMAKAVQVFKDSAIAVKRLRQEQKQQRLESERAVAIARETAEQAIGEEVARLADAFTAGELTMRISTAGRDGIILTMTLGINRLAETIEKVIADLDHVLSALAEGNLTRRMTGRYHGAFERLKDHVNTTASELAEVVSRISEATTAISAAAAEVSSGSLDLAERTERQASSLEQTAASMEELSATVRTSADNAQRANARAGDAFCAAEQGSVIAGTAVEAITQIAEASRRITDIIGVIDEIAFQTNGLALNAAVEAARAGDAGKGFAVVAQEVRALAQRSAQASKQIKALILNSDDQVQNGVRLVRRAGDSLAGIVSGVQQVASLIEAIAVASGEQAATLDEINAAIIDLDEITQKNAALVEETSAVAQAMAERAGELGVLVGFFRLDPGAAGGAGRVIAPQHQGGRDQGGRSAAGRHEEGRARPGRSSKDVAGAVVSSVSAAAASARARTG